MPQVPDRTKRAQAAALYGADYERMLLTRELEWLRTLAHVAPCGIYRVDAAGRITYVNERWSELTGYAANEALGKRWDLAVHPADVERMREEWERASRERVPYRVEHRYLLPNGRVAWALTQTVREVDGRGCTSGFTGITADIAELHQMREELQASHQALEVRIRKRTAELRRMARIVETMDDAVVSCDLSANVLTWNRAAEAIFGYTAGEIVGQSFFLLVADPSEELARGAYEYLRQGGEIHRQEGIATTKAGELIEVEVSAFPLRGEDGEVNGSFGIIRNVTSLKRAERRLHRLSWRLMKVQDEERRRIARDLHDSTAQELAALSMNLAALAREEQPLSEERRRQVLRESVALAERATEELRTTSYLLHPPLLDERGLRAALGWFIDGFKKRSHIQVTLEVAAELDRLPLDIETTLFSVAREALHNVHRHAESERAEVRLVAEDGGVRLEVRDWGRGMAAPGPEYVGVGIAGMRERLLQFGGTLEVEAAEPGTRVIGRIPLSP